MRVQQENFFRMGQHCWCQISAQQQNLARSFSPCLTEDLLPDFFRDVSKPSYNHLVDFCGGARSSQLKSDLSAESSRLLNSVPIDATFAYISNLTLS